MDHHSQPVLTYASVAFAGKIWNGIFPLASLSIQEAGWLELLYTVNILPQNVVFLVQHVHQNKPATHTYTVACDVASFESLPSKMSDATIMVRAFWRHCYVSSTLASILAGYGMVSINPLNAMCCLLAKRQDIKAPLGVYLSGHDNNMRLACPVHKTAREHYQLWRS